ncbi:MAG: phosphatase PAP2 family protein [Angelakisella sp.]
MDGINAFEITILDFIRKTFESPFLDGAMRFISFLGSDGLIFIALCVALLCFKKTRVCGAVLGTALIFDALAVNVILKPICARVRPYDINTAIELIVRAPKDFSFPSGHAAVAFAAAAALGTVGKKTHIAALVFATLMGLSRMYLYVHYPTDVLGGAIIGTLCGFLAVLLWKKITSTKIDKNIMR